MGLAQSGVGVDTCVPWLGLGGRPIFGGKVSGVYVTCDNDGDPRLGSAGHYHVIDWASIAGGDTGTVVEFIVFDNQEPGYIKTYPIVTADNASEVFVTDAYGVTVTIEEDILSSVYGIVIDVSGNAVDTTQFDTPYGVVTYMSEVQDVLKIYYRAKPTTITSINDSLEIDDKWDAAIKHYVVGMALHDDQDTQNRAVSADEIGLYGVEFGEAKQISAQDSASRSEHRTSYNSEI